MTTTRTAVFTVLGLMLALVAIALSVRREVKIPELIGAPEIPVGTTAQVGTNDYVWDGKKWDKTIGIRILSITNITFKETWVSKEAKNDAFYLDPDKLLEEGQVSRLPDGQLYVWMNHRWLRLMDSPRLECQQEIARLEERIRKLEERGTILTPDWFTNRVIEFPFATNRTINELIWKNSTPIAP